MTESLRKIRRILGISHPRAVVVFTLIALGVAVITEGGLPSWQCGFPLAMAMALIQISIGVFNDYCDRDLDAVHKPGRPIPAGLVSARQAYWVSFVSGAIGLAASATLGLRSLAVLAVALAIGVLYSAHFKRSVLSWLPYAIAYPIVPVWVWVSLGEFRVTMLLIYPAVVPLAIGVHLCNQLRDYDKDAEQGMKGFVHYLGKRQAGQLCVGLLFIGPLVALATTYDGGKSADLLLASSCIHWLVLMQCLYRDRGRLCEETWKTVFPRLQITGPLMLIGWVQWFAA